MDANAGNRKQLDDITENILLLEKQLAAREETLAKGNDMARAEINAINALMALTDDRIKKSIITSPIEGTVMAKYAETGG